MAIKHFTVRLDEELLHKFHVVANYEARSANSEAVLMIRRRVERFEKLNGEIEISKKKEEK